MVTQTDKRSLVVRNNNPHKTFPCLTCGLPVPQPLSQCSRCRRAPAARAALLVLEIIGVVLAIYVLNYAYCAAHGVR